MLHLFVVKLTMPQFEQLERAAVTAKEYGEEVSKGFVFEMYFIILSMRVANSLVTALYLRYISSLAALKNGKEVGLVIVPVCGSRQCRLLVEKWYPFVHWCVTR